MKRFSIFVVAWAILSLIEMRDGLYAQFSLPERLGPDQVSQKQISLDLPAAMIGNQYKQPAYTSAHNSGGLVTIFSDGFEGDFPGSWRVNAGDYSWAKRDCKARKGAFSAWAVGGGNLGSSLTCTASYPNNATTVMVIGPFDLSDANWAGMSFALNLNSESGRDFVSFLASDDGARFDGYGLSGATSGWLAFTFTLHDVSTPNGIKNFTGRPAVWVAIGFSSNSSSTRAGGAFIDDVVIRKTQAKVPTIVSSFRAPGFNSRGLVFDGSNLWCSDTDKDSIFQLTTQGRKISSFKSPGRTPIGLAWDGASLFNADSDGDKVFQLSTAGATLASFPTPGKSATSIAWNGSGLYLSDALTDTVWNLNTSGGITNIVTALGTFHTGLAWDGANLWMSDADAGVLFKLDNAGSVVETFLLPGDFPAGVTFQGPTIWLADVGKDLIYQLSQNSPPANEVSVPGVIMQKRAGAGFPTRIAVRIANKGSATQTNFSVSYQVNNNPPVQEIVPESVGPFQEITYSFKNPWVPPAVGNYTILIRANVPDQNPSDNAQQLTIPAIVPRYMGTWQGTTSQNRALFFRINSGDIVDSVTVSIFISWILGRSCTETFTFKGEAFVDADTFRLSLTPPLAMFSDYPVVRGRMTGRANCTGSINDFSIYGGIVCGTFSFGTGFSQGSKTFSVTGTLVAVDERAGAEAALTYDLLPNYPNPFWSEATSRFAGNPGTEIVFTVPKSSPVKIVIYDILGRAVRTLADKVYLAGKHEISWDGIDQNGNIVASGVYFYQFRAGSFSQVRKMSLLR